MNSTKQIFRDTFSALRSYSILEMIQLLLALFFIATLTLDQKLNSKALGLLLVSLLFTFRFSNLKKYRWPILIFIAGFLLSLISLSYSPNVKEGIHVVERQLSLFFLPLLFFGSFKMDRIKFHILLKFFYVSIVLVGIYLLKSSADKFFESQVTIKDWFVKDNLYHSFARPVGMHATFLSLYVGMGIFIGFYFFLLNRPWWIKVLVFLSAIVLAVTLTMLSSRVVLGSVVGILFFVYPFYIGRRKNKLFLLLAGLAISFLLFFVVRESSFISDRFSVKLEDEVRLSGFLHPDSTYKPIYGGETRADRWFCAAELVREKPLLGYGTGSEKDVLMEKFKKYNLQNAVINNYDAHSQYFAFAIKSGIPGLLFFLVSVFYAIYVSIRKKSFVYLSFTLLFAVACITENVLESNKGIFFFAFLNSLFCLFCLHEPNDPAPSSHPDT